MQPFPGFKFLRSKYLHTRMLQSDWHFFVQLYFGIIKHLYNRIWIVFIPTSDVGLFLTGCQVPLYLCSSVSESRVIKYANSLPLKEGDFIYKRFKNLETKSLLSKRTTWAINPISYCLPPAYQLECPWGGILRMHQEKVKMFIIQSMDMLWLWLSITIAL